MKVYQKIANLIAAKANCAASGNAEWREKHQEGLDVIERSLPSGSGFDSGTLIDAASTPEQIVLRTCYHHMNEDGSYDGWTDHAIVIAPSLQFGIKVRVTGRSKPFDGGEHKRYVAEVFYDALNEER